MVPPRRRAAPVKPEDAELDKRGMSRLKSVAESGPPTVGALRGRGRGRGRYGAAPTRGGGGGRGRGRGGSSSRGRGLPPSVRAPPSFSSSSSRGTRPLSARPSYYSTSTDSSYYANVPRDSGYRPRPRVRSPSPDRPQRRRDSTPPPLLPPAPPSPRRYRPQSPDTPPPPSPSPASDDGQEKPYDYTLLRPAADQRWGEEESFNRRYSPSRTANIPLPPQSLASASRSPEVPARELQPIVVEDDEDGQEITPQPETSKAATGPNVPPRFKPRNPNPRPNTRSSTATAAAAPAPAPPTTARPPPLSAKAAGKQPARPDVKPAPAALREVVTESSHAGPAVPRTEGVLALRNDAFPPGCLGPASAARRAARTTWMRKLKQDLADEGRTAVSFKWRDDGLAIDWVVAPPRPAHNHDDGDDNDDFIEIVAPPPPVRAPTPISIASSPEPEPDENDRLPTLTPDSPMPDHRDEPIVTRSQSTPRKDAAPATPNTGKKKGDKNGKNEQAAEAAELNIPEAEWLALAPKDRSAYRKLRTQAETKSQPREELARLNAEISVEGAVAISQWREARRLKAQEEQRANIEKRQRGRAEAEKRKTGLKERERRSKLTWCSVDDMNVPSRERGVVSQPLPNKYRNPADRKSAAYREWAAHLIEPCRHLSGDGFRLNKVDTWVQDGKLYVEWGPFTDEELEEQALNLLGDDAGPTSVAQPPAPVPPAPTKPAPPPVEKQATPRRSASPIKRAVDRRSMSPVRQSARQEGDVRARTPERGNPRLPSATSSPPYSPSNPIHHDNDGGDTSMDTADAGGTTKRPRADSFIAPDAPLPPSQSPRSPAVSFLAPAESPIEHTGWAPCSPPPPAKRARLGSHEPFTPQRESGWYPHPWAVPEAHEDGEGVEVNGAVEEAGAEPEAEVEAAADAEAEVEVEAEVGAEVVVEPECKVEVEIPTATPMATEAEMDTPDVADADATVPSAPALPAQLVPAEDTSRGPSPAPSAPDNMATQRSASVSLSVSGEMSHTPPPPGAGTSHLSPRARYAELSARMERLFDTIDRWTRLMDKHPHRADGLRRQIERTEADIFALQNEMDAAQAEAEAADAEAGGTEGAEGAGDANADASGPAGVDTEAAPAAEADADADATPTQPLHSAPTDNQPHDTAAAAAATDA